MSKLSKLMGKSRFITIEGEQIELKPLNIDEVNDISEFASKNPDNKQILKYAVKKVLKKSIEDATDEEIENLDPKYYAQLIPVILDIIGIEKKKVESIQKQS